MAHAPLCGPLSIVEGTCGKKMNSSESGRQSGLPLMEEARLGLKCGRKQAMVSYTLEIHYNAAL